MGPLFLIKRRGHFLRYKNNKNYIQDGGGYLTCAVTDHRIGLTIRRLDRILEGDLDGFVDALTADEQAQRLAKGE